MNITTKSAILESTTAENIDIFCFDFESPQVASHASQYKPHSDRVRMARSLIADTFYNQHLNTEETFRILYGRSLTPKRDTEYVLILFQSHLPVRRNTNVKLLNPADCVNVS